jgi:hypothetical protein
LLSIDEFEERLHDLVTTSARNGIAFDRSWTFRGEDEEVPDVMIEITQLQSGTQDS